MEVLSAKCKTGIGFWYLSYFVARVIFRGLSAKSHDICQFSARANVVSVSCLVSTMKRQQTMLSFLSSNKRSRRVAGKFYKNFRGKQNIGYIMVMEKQPIARNNCLDSSAIAPRTRRDKASLHCEILLEICLRQRFERSLESKISRQCKSSEFLDDEKTNSASRCDSIS